jgi:hypothetical protein
MGGGRVSEQVMSDGAHGMSVEQQVDYWQGRYFALLDEHASCLNQLQAIRRLLDDRQWEPDANYPDAPEETP